RLRHTHATIIGLIIICVKLLLFIILLTHLYFYQHFVKFVLNYAYTYKMSDNGYDLASNSSRHEKSLGLLTTRFVSLLQDAKDGILDLKQVCISILCLRIRLF